ncbi:hypothetical protein EJ08DRAFT_519905 [Tothia fuscella]|uniref:SWIM-type domain-containing protein n=1 Tax=Tothia fuscella TaxID=1048955 RepID=A0A9P4NHI0_9PEZI|nr:hypothetical protein EJ08DRAFT_519905 [Tothia fuscella]
MSTTLPNPRTLITKLLSSIPPPIESTNVANPLKNASTPTKHALQTLHVLYPNEFLPALDLLDRHLLMRLTLLPISPARNDVPNDTASPYSQTHPQVSSAMAISSLYYVRSAQQPKQYYGNTTQTTSNTPSRDYDPLATYYEVRPLAWNCSCPAFAFSAFPAAAENDDDDDESITEDSAIAYFNHTYEGERAWQFGGLGLGSNIPVCKHLLACILVERCEIFKDCVEERVVSVEEIAGWAAGWGG